MSHGTRVTENRSRGFSIIRDIYYPQYGLAIEIQGVQHEKYHEGDPNNFIKQQARDQLKNELCEENWIVLSQLCIDYGRLLKTVQHGHKLGCAPVIVGLRPPLNDSIWRHINIQEQGYEVTVFDRDPISHREKEFDIIIKLAVSAVKTITTNDPGILILVTGDRDYTPLYLGRKGPGK
ncbi:4815_t:CDS:2 [Paraglomus occultum]|uniref:4815_t:CDS:1 n=1 Tax=Paraglomus occultum TaxID=144539 RepID=A0A9N9FBF3_9GLOM|nr:4815_t:CDS:2 [Paraglomus occultum]